MANDIEALLAQKLWRELGGASADAAQLEFSGEPRLLASVFQVSALASACVGVATLAVAELDAQRRGAQPRCVSIDRAHASVAFRSERYLQGVGWDLPPIWDPVAGDYAAHDGFVRLHTNYAYHRTAAERALGATTRDGIAMVIRERSAEEVEHAVVAAGGCAAACRSVDAWRAHPQGRAVAERALFEMSEPRRAPAAWQADARADLPLSGLRVLDLTRVLAGPTCTRFLSAYGADVLRIDPVGFQEVEALVCDTTWGKRRARLDLRQAGDREHFEVLLANAHVLVHGYRGDALTRLGFGAERRAELAPALIDVSLNAYGSTGPWALRRGFDSLVQMSCGIAQRGMEALAMDRPHPLPAQALDHGTGYLMAAAVGRALSRQLRDGLASSVRLSLAGTAACLLSLGETHDARGPEPSAEQVRPYLDEVDSQLGRLRRVRCPGSIEGIAKRTGLPAGPLGSDPAVWP